MNLNPLNVDNQRNFNSINNQNNLLQNDMSMMFQEGNNNINSYNLIENSFGSNIRYLNKPAEKNPISSLNYNMPPPENLRNQNYATIINKNNINNNNNSQSLQIINNGNTLQVSIEDIIDKIRKKLVQRGITGILSIGKSFKINDSDNSKTISFNEFANLCQKYGLGLSDLEIRSAFAIFDKRRNGNIDYEEFLQTIRGSLNPFRKSLVEQAFGLLDKNKNGYIDYNDIVAVYDVSKHPLVMNGQRTPDSVYNEFLTSFSMNHSNFTTNKTNFKITKDEWIEYYEHVSMSIDDDAYFELMMNNCWRMNNNTTYNNNVKGWSNKSDDVNTYKTSLQDTYQKKNNNIPNNNSSNMIQTIQYNNNRNVVTNNNISNPSANFNNNNNRNVPSLTQKEIDKGNTVLEKFRSKLFSRGSNSLFSLARQFKIMDDDNSKTISFDEFTKLVKDFRIDLTQSDILALFTLFDRNRNNTIDYDEFIRIVRGEMNERRKAIVIQAFNLLDSDKSGIIEIADLKNKYNMRKNPDVLSGKKSEEEAYGEFLQTLEIHFNMYKGKNDRKVTLEEFLEYYNNISCSIDNDDYFELMMKNSWNFDNKAKYPAGWSNDYSNQSGNNNNYANNIPSNQNSNMRNNNLNNNIYNNAGSNNNINPMININNNFNPYNINNNTNRNPGIQLGKNNGYFNPVNDPVMQRLREKIMQRGIKGIMGIQRSFKIGDKNNDRTIDSDELRRLLKLYRFDITEAEFRKLFEIFDRDRAGKIDYDEFIYGIVGEMNDFRKSLVQKAFAKFDKTGDGKVDIDDVRLAFNAKLHPDVRAGRKTEDEILASFLDNFETHFMFIVKIYFFKIFLFYNIRTTK